MKGSANMADLEESFLFAAKKFKLPCLNSHQKLAITKVINEGRDVFVNLPTGFGKSLIFQALPIVFDHVTKSTGHISVVVSPLLSLMDDQVHYLRSVGVSAASISTCTEDEASIIEKGEFSVVFGSPEAWLCNDRWKTMLSNSVYKKQLSLIAIDEAHVIKQWGTSTSNKMNAFRESYGKLYELKSLAPKVPMIALTATAAKLTQDTIKSILLMKCPFEISESPNKVNITYTVTLMEMDSDLEWYFGWLMDELQKAKEHCERTIIYCQTIKQCGIIYGVLKGMLGNNLYIATETGERQPLVEMLHSCTPEVNKKNILSSFQHENGTIRLLIATIAFGMGVDCKGVHRIIHYGPSKNIEAFVQETGRAGRDGSQSISYLLYHGMLLNHVDGDIKCFIKSNECRRKTLLDYFESDSKTPVLQHLCCDNCALSCCCGMPDCKNYAKYPIPSEKEQAPKFDRSLEIKPVQRKLVREKLISYHKSLLIELMGTSANAELKTVTNIPFMLGFGEQQILQVINNLHNLFLLSDVYKAVEIWDKRHAQKVMSIIGDVFQDVECYSHSNHGNDEDDFESFDVLDEWNDLLCDDELFEMIAENITLSHLEESSLLDHKEEDTNADDDML